MILAGTVAVVVLALVGIASVLLGADARRRAQR
jgi:hypothetical protein